jgi:hypothetical protein
MSFSAIGHSERAARHSMAVSGVAPGALRVGAQSSRQRSGARRAVIAAVTPPPPVTRAQQWGTAPRLASRPRLSVHRARGDSTKAAAKKQRAPRGGNSPRQPELEPWAEGGSLRLNAAERAREERFRRVRTHGGASAPFHILSASHFHALRQFFLSEGDDVADQEELDGVLAWLKASDEEEDTLAWMANPAAVAFMRQGLMLGYFGVD